MSNTKYYIRWFSPGAFVADTHDFELENKEDIPERPNGCYAYQTFERVEKMVDGELLLGGKKKFSPVTYYGQEFTKNEAKQYPEATHILLMNMETNGWTRMVRTIYGQWLPLREGDGVISK